MFVINTNLDAQSAANNLIQSQNALSKSLSRLSSGSRITSPEDDSAGLAVSLRLDAQSSRINSAQSNVGNAVSFSQTQDGFLSEIGKGLSRMSELALLALDETKTDSDRALYSQEFSTLSSYITTTAKSEFNGVSLFNGNTVNVTIDGDGNSFAMTGINLGAAAFTTATGSSVGTTVNAGTALTNVKAAIKQLSSDRAQIGSSLSRLSFESNQLTISKENLTAASSRIRDVDVATEATEFARFNILVQSGTAMLAQANQLPQSVLRLLQ